MSPSSSFIYVKTTAYSFLFSAETMIAFLCCYLHDAGSYSFFLYNIPAIFFLFIRRRKLSAVEGIDETNQRDDGNFAKRCRMQRDRISLVGEKWYRTKTGRAIRFGRGNIDILVVCGEVSQSGMGQKMCKRKK